MLKKHSVSIRGHRTSFSLEDAFWNALHTLAQENNTSLSALVTRIDANRSPGQNLSSALRLFVLKELEKKLDAAQHSRNEMTS